jgi:hypothetical protein
LILLQHLHEFIFVFKAFHLLISQLIWQFSPVRQKAFGVVLEVIVQVWHCQNCIAFPAKLGLTKRTDHFVASIYFFYIEGALRIRALFCAFAQEK